LSNLAMAVVTAVTLVLGTAGVLRAGAAVLGRPAPDGATLLAAGGGLCLLAAVPLGRALVRRRGQ
ncbi:MAG: hypothetical protein R3325_11410, partial [Thermoanaerobaculia bacterium]|nr:hypothetical protein [Thermoanaerobaculia bacterium]